MGLESSSYPRGVLIKSQKVERPSWDEYFMTLADTASTRSPCSRLKVGCILVKDNRIVSQGYNGFLPGVQHTSIVRDGHEQCTVHAEQNAVSDCAKRGGGSCGCVAYISHYPCLICFRLLLAAGIKKVIYRKDYKNDDIIETLSEWAGVEVIKNVLK